MSPFSSRPNALPKARLAVLALAVGVAALAHQPPGTGRHGSAVAHRSLSSEELVINEVDYDQPGTDTAEFVELRNVSAQPINLAGYYLLGINGGALPATVYRRDHLPSVILLPGQYFVIGSPLVPSVDFVVGSTNIWQNGAPDAIALVKNSTDNPANDQLVDSVSYEGDTLGGPPTGGFWTETAGEVPGDDGSDMYAGISRYPDGYDSDDNAADFAPRCITPGEPNTSRSAPCTGPGTPSETPELPTPAPGEASPTAPVTPTLTSPAPTTVPPEPTAATLTPTGEPTAPPAQATATASPATPLATATPLTGPPLPSVTPQGPDPTPAPGPPTAIELDYFVAYRFPERVILRWRTLSEIDHAGFLIWRQDRPGNGQYVTVRLIRPPAGGGELAGATYAFADPAPPAKGSTYWLDDVDCHGRITRHGPAHFVRFHQSERPAQVSSWARPPDAPQGPIAQQ